MAESLYNSEPQTPWYAQPNSASSSAGAYNTPKADNTWQASRKRDEECFHRYRAEQAEYGGYAWDAQYHRNMERNYRS